MQKATATYHAPSGDNKVVEMGGVTFFDGQPVELNSDDHAHLLKKLPGNHHFDFDLGEVIPDEPKKRGRPSNAELAARAEKAEADAKAETEFKAKLSPIVPGQPPAGS